MRIDDLKNFIAHLKSEGRSTGTIEKYQRDVRAFAAWLDDLDLEEASGWREYLLERGYAPVTVNSMPELENHTTAAQFDESGFHSLTGGMHPCLGLHQPIPGGLRREAGIQ